MRARRTDLGGRESGRLAKVLSGVRTRWRIRRTVSGSVWVLLAALAAIVLTGFGLEATRFSPSALLTFRVLAWGAVAGLAVWRVLLPWLQKVDDEQVALYLQEHEPTLQASIMGAVEAERARASGAASSPGLLDALVQRAVERARRVENGRNIDRPALVKSSGVLAFVSVFALGLLLFGPASIQRGATSLLPTASAAELNPYSIAIEPGDVSVARGSDQFITARLQGFGSESVTLYRRGLEVDVLQQLTMIPTAEAGEFELLLLALDEGFEYFVESDGVRSPTYTVEVVDLPYVETMAHEYRWPAYTGLPVERVEEAGDLVVLPGTRVRVEIASTIPTGAGRLIVDDNEPIDLVVEESGTVVGEFTVRARGYYRIELALGDGTFVAASPEYRIDLLSDRAPTITIEEPGRDTDVSAIEEVYIEARAEDDYGIGDLKLVYSVNGAAEDTIDLFDASGAPLEEVTAGHTLFLEDYDLVDGDLVSFYATTADRRGAAAAPISSDIYFLQIRPFRRDFREAEQGEQPPGGQGGGQQPENPGLSELQRQVIAATFNLNRDRANYSEDEFAESTRSVALAQGRVREQVGTLTERMRNRGLSRADERFRMIAEMLPGATAAMDTARMMLDSIRTQEALGPEQRALAVLLKAEETYERMVQLQQQQQGGGGGQQQGADADDLADLFELELDKLENQYETVQRGERQETNQQVDELLEELEELARRQQQEAERQQARAGQQQSSAGGGSSAQSQRELADQAEEAARQLEQLSREQSDPDLADAARELQDAADAMRRAAANPDNSGAAESQRALEQLQEAERRLRDNREGRLEEDTESSLDRARSLRQQQEQIQQQLADLPTDAAGRREQIREISEQKGEMAQEAAELEQQLRQLAAEARQRDQETSRRLAEAADVMEETGVANAIRYSRGVVEQRDPEFARIFEERIRGALEELESTLEGAQEAAGRAAEEEGLERALDEARDLQQGAESLARRLAQRTGQQPGQTQQTQQGQQGQQGEQSEGQEGQQGQGQQGQNQPGQQGQQGQGQQGQQGQGQQGQQGQGQQGQQGQQGGRSEAGAPGEPLGPQDYSGSGAVSGAPEPLTRAEIEQYRREFEARLRDARELRGRLQEEGRRAEVDEIDAAVEALQLLANAGTYEDLRQVAQLQADLREDLGSLEFALRREVEGEQSDRAALTGAGAVPSEFRRLVDEYYRALARGSGGGN